MKLSHETARRMTERPLEVLLPKFPDLCYSGVCDAEFVLARSRNVIGVAGLPYYAPASAELMNNGAIREFVQKLTYTDGASVLFCVECSDECEVMSSSVRAYASYASSEAGSSVEELPLSSEVRENAALAINKLLRSTGHLNERGELVLDLKSCKIGPHYPINLLLGDRSQYSHPLVTTPKSTVDALGRGSFRASGADQVLATRYILEPEENGEPANRQFYLTENDTRIFYSADVDFNVKSAVCTHSQNRTVIKYETEDGLEITRTIFLLPQEEGMPNAVEAQHVEIINNSGRDRELRIVFTGVFGITNPGTMTGDIVYANLVAESELISDEDGNAIALTLHSKPEEDELKKRFAMLITSGNDTDSNGDEACNECQTMDEFCTSRADFTGNGTILNPDYLMHLPCTLSRKNASFFAMAKTLSVKAAESKSIDTFTGMCDAEHDLTTDAYAAISKLYEKYRENRTLAGVLESMTSSWESYTSYIVPESGDEKWDAYVRWNLPFQVLYQTYVSRAFAWTQKSYREIGFREIQDIFASMYYLSASGKNELVKELLGNWIRNVYEMGYANHNFTFAGKEPGDCSDDQLWLMQAVYNYVHLTGDVDFLNAEFEMADVDEKGRKLGRNRSLLETLRAILTYSGKISVGKHGLPLLDKADWNDTLRLDKIVFKGPQKEALYRKQLEAKSQDYGVPFDNEQCESVMNACLLKIAADQTAELAEMAGDSSLTEFAREVSTAAAENTQKFAWKDDYFARCLINDGRQYAYLGAGKDGLSLDPEVDGSYYLNSYSWAILADIATEEQIKIMLGTVNKYLKSSAGLKLCTLVDYDKLDVKTGTALYFPGDRENAGVFKHAAMMATVASLRAAKWVKDEELAEELTDLAHFMIDKTLPYKAMEDPFVLKGNPRFCTQYNNSETCENIGPMLSGTATWLTLAIYEMYGIDVSKDNVRFKPVMKPGQTEMKYTVNLGGASMHVTVIGDGKKLRTGDDTAYTCNGEVFDGLMKRPDSGEMDVRIELY